MIARCVLLAAGRGERSGLEINKILFRWQGRSVLARCLDALAAAQAYDGVWLVVSPGERAEIARLLEMEGPFPLLRAVVDGGATRCESAWNGLCALPADTQIVSIHDAARPFVTPDVVRATLSDAENFGSGVISTPVVDTIKQLDPLTGAVSTPARSLLRAVQTPQSFNYAKLMAAHRRARQEAMNVTDDAMIYEAAYGTVHLSQAPGAQQNIKLTTPEDFRRLNAHPEFRVGFGYDAHRLVAGRKLILCGVEIKHDRGLDGHSDADVAVHALMDALLGAIGEGDIGRHFPDSDPAYRGICSMLLLERVMALLQARAWRVVNADITIVAQRPKLAACIPAMRDNIACALNVAPDCANVKATTTERMGFEGEEIGISAQATVMLTRDGGA